MLDNGFPLATEANILKELIKPPNMLRDVVNSGKCLHPSIYMYLYASAESFLNFS